MRIVFVLFSMVFWTFALGAHAQSVLDNLPTEHDEAADAPMSPPLPVAPPVLNPQNFTVMDVNADVTADTASHARDQALMQAERSALSQIYARAGVPDNSAKLTDDTIAALVQSFDLQSERQSAKRYIGVFTIHFKPSATQKKIGKTVAPDASAASPPTIDPVKPAVTGPISTLTIAVQTGSLAEWAQIKKRMTAAAPVARVDVLDLGRGTSHVDMSYGGSIPDLQQALTNQGLVLRQVGGVWQLYDGSMVPR